MSVKPGVSVGLVKDNKLLLLVMAFLINDLFGSMLKNIIAGLVLLTWKQLWFQNKVINTVLVILCKNYEFLKLPCVPVCIWYTLYLHVYLYRACICWDLILIIIILLFGSCFFRPAWMIFIFILIPFSFSVSHIRYRWK